MTRNLTALTIAFIMMLTTAIPQNGYAQDDKRENISTLVRLLGYGAAIHNFKNYVLRGNEKYGRKANQFFSEAKLVVAKLRENNLDNDELIAVKSIDEMIDAYLRGVDIIKKIMAEEKSLAKIIIETDKKVKVDDTAAIEGINALRKSYTWNELETVEYNLGYGGAIHNFKNYLLRGKAKYRERSAEYFNKAMTVLTSLEKSETSADLKQAAVDINTTAKKYLQSLPRIKKTAEFILKSSNARIISSMVSSSDKMVRVNDSPAITGLSALGRKYHGG